MNGTVFEVKDILTGNFKRRWYYLMGKGQVFN